MLGPRREIDLEAPAQRIQARLRPGKAPAGERERILDGAAQGLLAEPAQLGIDEFEVELGIVDDQPSVADEIQELVGDRGKGGMLGEKFRRQPMDRIGLLGHLALGIDVAVKDAPARHVIDELDTGDLHDTVTGAWVETGRLSIEDDFPHAASPVVPPIAAAVPQPPF